MAKFVCDFDQITQVGENLVDAASQIRVAASSYSSKIDGDLSSWTGQAKNSFSTQNSKQVEAANEKANDINEFGEFIIKAAQSIENLDNELGSLSI